MLDRTRTLILVSVLLLAPLLAAPGHAQYSETVKRTLLSILNSENLPCGEVDSYERLGEFDFRVNCSNNRSYRIWRSEDGVKVESV